MADRKPKDQKRGRAYPMVPKAGYTKGVRRYKCGGKLKK